MIVKYVRGNSMLLTVTLTEKHPEGDPTAVDVETYDSWAAHVFRCGSVMRSDAARRSGTPKVIQLPRI